MWKWNITFVEFNFVSGYGTCVELNAWDQLSLSRLIVDLEEVNENVAAHHERTFDFVDELLRGDGHDVDIWKENECEDESR